MKRQQVVFGIYIAVLLLLNGLIFATPFIAFNGDASGLYKAFSYACHQKLSRSLCLFSDGNGNMTNYWMASCTNQSGKFVNTYQDRLQTKAIQSPDVVGYKIPVCSRDVGIYGAMLLAGIAYPFLRRLEETKVWPTSYLVLAIVPLGVDGTVQLLSELGLLPFVYESTNEIRLLTGVIAGVALSFYAIAILMNMFGTESTDNKSKKKKK
ncbi:DUF2085 domain-containing protein [Candidatus Micrarchaeota archaeon]|nr:DUF2085 domain-containing protein [Candidatus Micrarchaeota archaeon]